MIKNFFEKDVMVDEFDKIDEFDKLNIRDKLDTLENINHIPFK